MVKGNRSSTSGKKKRKSSALKHPEPSSKKTGKTKTGSGHPELFFRPIPVLFFCRPRQSLGRFRGGRATQKVVQTKTQVGSGSIKSSAGGGPAVAVSTPGNCKRKVAIGPTTHAIMHSWRPKTGRGLEFITTLVDSKHKNGRAYLSHMCEFIEPSHKDARDENPEKLTTTQRPSPFVPFLVGSPYLQQHRVATLLVQHG